MSGKDASGVALAPIPVTVFTGFLGAGKTSIILSLLPKLPEGYKAVLLKNEFGDVEVDSKLAQQSSLTAVEEILNGCMCCILVGQMQTALLEIRDKFRPDRIIIECSGSAFPATLAFQIRELERQSNGDLKLDSIVTVIDAENFVGYEDTSPTAKMQASYTDLILINKWEHVSEIHLDIVIEHLNTLNDLTPKIKCQGRNGVDPDLLFGLESKLFMEKDLPVDGTQHDEVETITLRRSTPRVTCQCCHEDPQHSKHVDSECTEYDQPIEKEKLVQALNALRKDSIWRVKGFLPVVEFKDGTEVISNYILNWAFGRYELTPYDTSESRLIKLSVMGERGEVKRAVRQFASALDLNVA